LVDWLVDWFGWFGLIGWLVSLVVWFGLLLGWLLFSLVGLARLV